MEYEKTQQLVLTDLDRKLAVPMFVVALLFLLIGGFLLHTEPGELEGLSHYPPLLRRFLWIALGLLYLAIVGEFIAHRNTGGRNLRQHWWMLAVPFFRLSARDHVNGECVWIPGLGWQKSTRALEQHLSRLFSGPMIVIALLVLPVVGIELIWARVIESHVIWQFALQTATGFIWMAFVVEFVVMFTVVEKKLRYCKQNWIDIAIIVLPLFAFLRIARLGRLLKVQQISRTANIYRMRGLALRSWRAIVTLGMIDRLLRRDPSYRIDKLEQQILEKEAEIHLLKSEVDRIREKAIMKLPKSTTNS